ncbi:MAG: J domain-containing protein [Gammaproteobacteria bacterium]|nr:J domain-containing protein [Gammaproteobacteria bacterium]
MENRRNLYRILHVQPDAPEEIIRSSYRTLMTKLRRHPDLGGDHYTATLINEAYAVLSDPARRAAYDEACRSVAAGRPEPAGPPAASPPRAPACPFCGAVHGLTGPIHSAATCTTCNSPLAPAVRERLDSGQRAVSRVPRRIALSYFTGWPGQGPFPGETRDLSLHGLLFVANSALPVNRVIKVDCEPLVALARVVACKDNDQRDWRWLIRTEYVTVRFRRPRGGFVATRA